MRNGTHHSVKDWLVWGPIFPYNSVFIPENTFWEISTWSEFAYPANQHPTSTSRKKAHKPLRTSCEFLKDYDSNGYSKIRLPRRDWDWVVKQNCRGQRRQRRSNKTNYTRQNGHVNMLNKADICAFLLSNETSAAPFPRCLQNVTDISRTKVHRFVQKETLESK